MRRIAILAIVLAAACGESPTTTTHATAPDGAAQASLGVTLVPSGYTGPQVLGFLEGGHWGEANAINNSGQIAGTGGTLLN